MLQSSSSDVLAAGEAIAILAFFYSPERGHDGTSLRLASSRLCKGHRLHLHGVQAREAADAVLIEPNRRPIGLRQAVLFLQLSPPNEELASKMGDIERHYLTSSTGTCTVLIMAVVVLPTISVRRGECP